MPVARQVWQRAWPAQAAAFAAAPVERVDVGWSAQMKAVQCKTTADTADLDEMVRRIAEGFKLQRIILFGSHARGDATEDSDYDLLIIAPSSEPRWRRSVPIYEALMGLRVAKDIVWWTEEEVAEWQAVRNHFVNSAISEGRVVYEATA